MFSSQCLDRRQRSPGRAVSRQKHKQAPIRKRAQLLLELLEDRTQPSVFASTGVLGNLVPLHQVAFNTTTGMYTIDDGPPLAGGVLSPDPGHTTMLYNFAAINLGANVLVTASGSHSLGLLGTSDIIVSATLDFAGQPGQRGHDGYGIVGGGGGGGGGGGALLLATSGGRIDFAGVLNVSGGNPGERGVGFLDGVPNVPGKNPAGGGGFVAYLGSGADTMFKFGSEGGVGGTAGPGGGSGGDGGGSVAGGAGGSGGNAGVQGGGGGGGGGGANGGNGGLGGTGLNGGVNGNNGSNGGATNGGNGGNSGNGPGGVCNGGGGGGGGGLANNGTNGTNGVSQGGCSGGGGGGGGGGDASGGQPWGFGGTGGTGGTGGGTGGNGSHPVRPRNATVPQGSGGGGSFILAASGGVFFSGTAIRGTGVGVVYGDFHNTGRWTDGLPATYSYFAWDAMRAERFYLTGGAGGGGGGGDGQLEVPSDGAILLANLLAVVQPEPHAGGVVNDSPAVAEVSPAPATSTDFLVQSAGMPWLALRGDGESGSAFLDSPSENAGGDGTASAKALAALFEAAFEDDMRLDHLLAI